MTQKITYRKFIEGDIARISEFRKKFFSYNPSIRSCEPEYYEWKFNKNPALPGEIWLAEDGNTLVGIMSITPKRMKALGTILNGAELGDGFTHPEYQRRGILTKLAKNARESSIGKGVTLIYGTAYKGALYLPGYMKKMNIVPIPAKLRTLVKPVYPRQLLETKLRFYPLVSILCPIVEIASRTILKIGTAKAKKGNITISQETAFPNDIDTLWERASKNYDIMLVRNRECLRWRYVANPDNYSILIARSDSGEILGYMVTKLASYGDKKTGFLVDFLVTEDKPDVFRRLLVTAVGEYFKASVNLAYVQAIKGSMYDKILLRCGFIPYFDAPFNCYNNEIGSKVVSGTHKWHFTMGDTDNI